MAEKRLIVILGATAIGKTTVGIRLAQTFNSEIISSDSRQIYRELSIGTAKPTPAELSAVPHHMIGIRSIREEYSAGSYEQEALEALTRLFLHHDELFLVGGSGLYIDALCQGMDPLPSADDVLRRKLDELLQREGIDALADRLKELDPVFYGQVDRCNPRRIQRALEVCLQSGQPYSTLRQGTKNKRPFRVIKIGLEMPREALYTRINLRVDQMVLQGLEQEARDVYPLRHLNALQTVGYREWFDYFDGQISREQAIELIKRNSRRYAKRQQTWFRRDPQIIWFTTGLTCCDAIEKYLRDIV